MPGLGIKNVAQGTPAGYLVEMHDGSQRLFPESVLVSAGYVPPTAGAQSMVPQLPGPGSMDDIAPPPGVPAPGGVPLTPTPAQKFGPAEQVARPVPAPVSTSGSVRVGVSGDQLVKRNDVVLDTTPYDSGEIDGWLAESRDRLGSLRDDQGGLLAGRADAERQATEAVQGRPKVGPDGQPVLDATGQPVLEGGLVQAEAKRTEEDLAKTEAFDAATESHVARRQEEILQAIAEVPRKDPTKYWKDAGAFGAAVGLTAGIAGGILAVTTGSGRNRGLEAIEQAIQNDLNAQETNIENEWKKIAHDKDSLEAYTEFRGRTRQRTIEGQMLRRETLRQGFLAKAATFQSKAKQLEYAQYAADLGIQQEKDLQELLHREREWGLAVSQDAFNRDKVAEGMRLEKIRTSAEAAYHRAQTAKLNAEGKPEVAGGLIPVFTLPNGKQLFLDPRMTQGRTKEQIGSLANKLGEDIAKDAVALDAMQKHRQLVANLGRKYAGPGSARLRWSDEDRKVVGDSLEQVAASIAYSLSGAQYAESFREAVKKWVGDAPGWTGQSPVKSQTEYIDSLLTKLERNVGGRGVISADAVKVPGVEGPTPSGAPVRPDTQALEPRPFSAKKSFYAGDVKTTPEDPDLHKEARNLGRTILTGGDPGAALGALYKLKNTLEAPLSSAPVLAQEVFGQSELGTHGGRTTVRYPGEGKDRRGTSVRDTDSAVRLMRIAATRHAARADQAGDAATAAEIMVVADQIEQLMRGVFPGKPGGVLELDKPLEAGELAPSFVP